MKSGALNIVLPINNDDLIEGPEDFQIGLSNPNSATGIEIAVDANMGSITTTIHDTQGVGGPADGPAVWSISGSRNLDEGETAIYTIRLTESFGAGEVAKVNIGLNPLDTNFKDYADFFAAINDAVDNYSGPGTLTFDGTSLTFTANADGDTMDDLVIELGITDDILIEGPEDYRLVLSNATSTTGANVALDPLANGVMSTINDTQGPGGPLDGPIEWSISGPAVVNEGESAIYRVELTGTYQAGENTSVKIGLADIDTNGNDYGNVIAAIQAAAASNPDVSFDPSTSVLTFVAPVDGAMMPPLLIDLAIINDTLAEPFESFRMELSMAASTTGLIPSIAPAAASTVTTIQSPPVAKTDINDTVVNMPTTGNVLDNDLDPNGEALTVIGVNGRPIGSPIATTHGSIRMNPDGSYVYTPNSEFSGTDTFTYEICNSSGLCATATVTIEVRDSVRDPANTPPIANNDTASGFIDTPVTGSVISNDGDPDGDVVRVNTAPVSAPTNGTVAIHPNGTYTYTPNAGFFGLDSFVYEIRDAAGNTDTATVYIAISEDLTGAANDVPAANDDAGVGQKNQPIRGNLLANDSDPNGDALTINTVPAKSPLNGTLVINPNGTYLYTPFDDFVGNDSFVYEVCDASGDCSEATVYLTVFDNPPIATNDIMTVTSDTSASGNVLTNDDDPNPDDDLVVTLVNGQPVGNPIATSKGTLEMQFDGSYTYTPIPSTSGTDTFTYEVCDEAGNCTTATLAIEIRDTETSGRNAPPIATNDTASTLAGRPVQGSLTSNDGDPNRNSFSVNTSPITKPTNGTVVINPDGTFVYQPNAGFVGSDTFEYQICDSQGACDTAIATIFVVSNANGLANDAPVGGDDAAFTTKGRAVTGDLLANDSDPNGNPLTINTTPIEGPDSGTLRINADGTFRYVPERGFEGTVTFQYEVCDSNGACDVVTAHVTVFNLPPVANDDFYQVNNEVDPVVGNVFDNDFEPDGDPVNGSVVHWPTFGTLTWNSDGSFVYIPSPEFKGIDQFTYRICDDSGVCSIARVSIIPPFGYDTFTDESDSSPNNREKTGVLSDAFGNRETLWSHKIDTLASDPVLAGYATPGSRLIGRIYDTSGAVVGETDVLVDQAGNWLMQFFDTKVHDGYYVVIEHVSQNEISAGETNNFRLTEDTYRALQLGVSQTNQLNPSSILADRPGNVLLQMHKNNLNPLHLLE